MKSIDFPDPIVMGVEQQDGTIKNRLIDFYVFAKAHANNYAPWAATHEGIETGLTIMGKVCDAAHNKLAGRLLLEIPECNAFQKVILENPGWSPEAAAQLVGFSRCVKHAKDYTPPKKEPKEEPKKEEPKKPDGDKGTA